MNASAPVLSLRVLDASDADFASALDALTRFEAAQDPAIDAAVAAIIADVRARGDAAVLEYTARFDGVTASHVSELGIDRKAMRASFDALSSAERRALEAAAVRIRDFHARQKDAGFSFRDADGTELGQRVTPIDRA